MQCFMRNLNKWWIIIDFSKKNEKKVNNYSKRIFMTIGSKLEKLITKMISAKTLQILKISIDSDVVTRSTWRDPTDISFYSFGLKFSLQTSLTILRICWNFQPKRMFLPWDRQFSSELDFCVMSVRAD